MLTITVKQIYEKKLMVNIKQFHQYQQNKQPLSPQTIIYGNGNPGPGLEQAKT